MKTIFCLIVASLLTVVSADAAIVVVQHNKNDSGSTGLTTLAVTVSATASGNIIVVGVAGGNTTNTATGVTDNGSGGSSTYTLVSGTAGGPDPGGGFTSFYWTTSSHSGATTITATYSSVDFPMVVVWEVSGFTTPVVDGTNTIDTTSGTTTANGASITTTGATSFVAAIITLDHSVSQNPKVGNEFTSGGDIGAATGGAGTSLVSVSAAAHQPVWLTTAAATYVSSTMGVKESSGAACTPTMTLLGVGRCGDDHDF